MRVPAIDAIERELYDERALVRVLGMRRTMFVLPVELAPVVQAACTRAIAVKEHRALVGFIEQSGVVGQGTKWEVGWSPLERELVA